MSNADRKGQKIARGEARVQFAFLSALRVLLIPNCTATQLARQCNLQTQQLQTARNSDKVYQPSLPYAMHMHKQRTTDKASLASQMSLARETKMKQ